MSAVILGWDPSRWTQWNYPAVVEQVAVSGVHLEPWSVRPDVAAGADAWLVLQGTRGPGLLGHGVVHPDPQLPAGGPETSMVRVQVAFDALLPLGDQVPANVLREALPGVMWDTVGQGDPIAPGDEAGLRSLWAEFGPAQGPDPTLPTPGTCPGAAVFRRTVNRYENDPEARRACIAHRGTSCAACGFSFEAAYGEAGTGFIDVHHVVPASQLGGSYQLDPLTDLVPLCANCHAMAHYGLSSPRSVAELRRITASAGYLRGSTVTSDELEAQQIAREILGHD
ncbi:HNH endonuclease [Pseudarthrobacter sulfonivorans]|uniref:HNH endonuclease n=1 Tax=Pseudarthrobacter sulfonivorans TaxID=121292 RepID=UPI002105542A|nr:HNH endonuclease [Pseudarthrobacter sulfonivorans]